MFLTRMGNGSKAVVTGDITQSDLPLAAKSGLASILEILQGVEGIAALSLTEADVVRHPLVKRIVHAYQKWETKT
jgi:phosphate starvation-inducible PhoH-like protein